MLTSQQCQTKYGTPGAEVERKFFTFWDIPDDINAKIKALPNKLYCNKDIVAPLEKAFRNLIAAGIEQQFKTFDGCYSIRQKRGSKAPSLHSWGVAIDLNAAWNGWMQKPTLTPEFVKCFTDAGFEWGGAWVNHPDGMHFQLKAI